MTTTISVPKCLVCETSFTVQDDWEKGEIIECTACGQEHEVTAATEGDVRIALAPEIEEDWGE